LLMNLATRTGPSTSMNDGKDVATTILNGEADLWIHWRTRSTDVPAARGNRNSCRGSSAARARRRRPRYRRTRLFPIRTTVVAAPSAWRWDRPRTCRRAHRGRGPTMPRPPLRSECPDRQRRSLRARRKQRRERDDGRPPFEDLPSRDCDSTKAIRY
jgi:hypothetical protein